MRKRVLAVIMVVFVLTACSYSVVGNAHAASSENVREYVSTRKQRLRARKKKAILESLELESEDVREKTETENSRTQKPLQDTQDTHKKPEINTPSKIYQEKGSSNRLIIRGY